MVKKYAFYCAALASAIAIVLFLQEAENSSKETGFMHGESTDFSNLNKYIEVKEEIFDLKWELFGTPEWSDSIPGPTDFATILITGRVRKPDNNPNPSTGAVDYFIPINSTRRWLNKEQNAIINALIKKSPPQTTRCSTRIFKSASSDNKFEGIDCRHNQEVVIVVMVKQPS